MSTDAKTAKYHELAHAMQSGVAMEIHEGLDVAGATPKHLRVGINAAMSDHGALARLLIRKGVITTDEYLDALNEGMQREVDTYTTRVQRRLGPNVKLA